MSDSSVGNLDFVDIHAQIESGREVRLPENSEDASQQLDALEFRSNNLLPLLDRFWRSIGHDEQLQEKLIFSDSMTIVHWWWKLRGDDLASAKRSCQNEPVTAVISNLGIYFFPPLMWLPPPSGSPPDTPDSPFLIANEYRFISFHDICWISLPHSSLDEIVSSLTSSTPSKKASAALAAVGVRTSELHLRLRSGCDLWLLAGTHPKIAPSLPASPTSAQLRSSNSGSGERASLWSEARRQLFAEVVAQAYESATGMTLPLYNSEDVANRQWLLNAMRLSWWNRRRRHPISETDGVESATSDSSPISACKPATATSHSFSSSDQSTRFNQVWLSSLHAAAFTLASGRNFLQLEDDIEFEDGDEAVQSTNEADANPPSSLIETSSSSSQSSPDNSQHVAPYSQKEENGGWFQSLLREKSQGTDFMSRIARALADDENSNQKLSASNGNDPNLESVSRRGSNADSSLPSPHVAASNSSLDLDDMQSEQQRRLWVELPIVLSGWLKYTKWSLAEQQQLELLQESIHALVETHESVETTKPDSAHLDSNSCLPSDTTSASSSTSDASSSPVSSSKEAVDSSSHVDSSNHVHSIVTASNPADSHPAITSPHSAALASLDDDWLSSPHVHLEPPKYTEEVESRFSLSNLVRNFFDSDESDDDSPKSSVSETSSSTVISVQPAPVLHPFTPALENSTAPSASSSSSSSTSAITPIVAQLHPLSAVSDSKSELQLKSLEFVSLIKRKPQQRSFVVLGRDHLRLFGSPREFDAFQFLLQTPKEMRAKLPMNACEVVDLFRSHAFIESAPPQHSQFLLPWVTAQNSSSFCLRLVNGDLFVCEVDASSASKSDSSASVPCLDSTSWLQAIEHRFARSRALLLEQRAKQAAERAAAWARRRSAGAADSSPSPSSTPQ